MNIPDNKEKLPRLSDHFKLFSGICLGIFLLILFFQPFGQIRTDTNEKLLFTAGLSAITFFFMWLFRIALPWISPKIKDFEKWNLSPEILIYVLTWIFVSVAFVFYIRYVGPLRMTMFLVFKISLVGLIPSIALKNSDERHSLNQLLKALLEKNERLTNIKPDLADKEIPFEVFSSENKSELIKLTIIDLMLVKSADNYVEIYYRENEVIRQKLIRNTLKNIEMQLRKYPEFIRCHRTCIVNKKFVLDFTRDYTGYKLKLSGYNEAIPVSRQYLVAVREAIITD